MSIFRSLLAKEVHHLLPMIFALLALEGLGLYEVLLSKSPDTLTFSGLSVLLDSSGASFYGDVLLLIGLVTGYILFPHEVNGRTLHFLWALPVPRWHIYLAKVGTGAGVLLVLLLFSQLTTAWVVSLNTNSISGTQFSWSLWWLELGLLSAYYLIALAYGVLISYYRTPGILVFLLIWVVTTTIPVFRPELKFLDITQLIAVQYRGQDVIVDWSSWLLHAVLATLSLLMAGYLWTHREDRATESPRLQAILGRLSPIVFGLLAILIVFGYGASVLVDQNQTQPRNNLRTLQTQHYQFSFRPEETGYAQLLVREADELFLQAESLLGTESNERVIADLTDTSRDHLGIAGWKRIRIQQDALEDGDERRHVLVHETSHVLADLAADGQLTDHAAYTSFFNEGLAEWVSYEVLGLANEQLALRQLAALAWHRLDIRFEDFLFTASFRSQYDENMVYALGEAWASALANTCGRDTAASVLSVMGQNETPQRIGGSAYWRYILQQTGCSLSEVNVGFDQLMQSYQSSVSSVPALTTAIRKDGDQLVVSLQLIAGTPVNTHDSHPAGPIKALVRLRDNPGVQSRGMAVRRVMIEPGQTAEVVFPDAMIADNQFQYQTGIEFLPGRRPFFGRWINEETR